MRIRNQLSRWHTLPPEALFLKKKAGARFHATGPFIVSFYTV
jgi:hypothetical protein